MWDQRYDQHDYFYGTEPNDFLRAMAVQLPTGGRLLCLAEGEGRNAVWLAAQGFASPRWICRRWGWPRGSGWRPTRG